MGDDNGDDGGESRWLTTYGDAMTLLLTFFVALLSMSTIEEESFQLTISSFRGAVGFLNAGRTLAPGELMDMGINVHELSEAETTVAENIPRDIEQMAEAEAEASVEQDERGIVIQVTDQLLFESGQVELTPAGRTFLSRVAQFLSASRFQDRAIRIEGHTDNVPPTNYASNWEISVLRSTNVVRHFVERENLPPQRFSAVGFGQTRPIASNETEEGRAQNRRVEIVLLRDDIQSKGFQRGGR
ncbi:MAG: OmpA/MotB family protein [bacterium]